MTQPLKALRQYETNSKLQSCVFSSFSGILSFQNLITNYSINAYMCLFCMSALFLLLLKHKIFQTELLPSWKIQITCVWVLWPSVKADR